MKARVCILAGLCIFVALPSFATGPRVLLLTCSVDRDGEDATYTGIARVEFLDPANYYASFVWGNTWTSNDEIRTTPYFGLLTPSDPEIDMQTDFTLDPAGGCTTGFIEGQNEDIDPIEYQSSQLCWRQYLCHLSGLIDSNGSLTQDGLTGNYSCTACIELVAFANDGWDFVGFSGAVVSTDPVVQVCMNGSDQTEYVHFVPSPPPPPPSYDQCGTGDAFPDGCSPIVIDFAHGGYELTGKNAPVWFDMTGMGNPAHIGWTATGADDALLWLDRDGNGRVSNGKELFGNFTILNDGHRALNGFEALREFDSNRDGFIDEQDPVWSRLMLWRDLNHDGVSQPEEIQPVAQSQLRRIELSYHLTGRRDQWGNVFRYESLSWIENERGNATPRPIYDIFFVTVP